jgi:hypothetical protein
MTIVVGATPRPTLSVMAGLVPAIHVFLAEML